MKVQHWSVTVRYAAPGSRPGNRRHPAPEDFCRRTVVGPVEPSTVEAVFDLLGVPEEFRARIRAHNVMRDFVEGRLVPDHSYPHHLTGGCYVNSNTPDEQFVEWSAEFVFVTRVFLVQAAEG